VLEIDPKHVKAYNNLGASLAETGRLEQAVDTFKVAIRLAPAYPNAYKNLAGVYLQAHNPVEARVYLEKYLALVPNDQQAAATLEKLRQPAPADSSNGKGISSD
jgi:Flp pilus assembly protein TadD